MNLAAPHKTSLRLVSVQEARELVLNVAQPLSPQKTPLELARGLTLAAQALALLKVPRFDNAAMDGYAVMSGDTLAATADQPVTLTLSAHTIAGQEAATLAPGQAVRIMTGAPVPDGADAVVKQELVSLKEGVIELRAPVLPGENLRRGGEVIQTGQESLPVGTALGPAALGWLFECGVQAVFVHPAPRVVLVTTGDEVKTELAHLGPASIPNSNLWTLRAALEEAGAGLAAHHHAQDDPVQLRQTLMVAMAEADVLLLTGGVSVGTHDFVAETLTELGLETVFHGVRQKPGKPLLFGRMGHRLVFGLPGNPASALTAFYVYVLPALQKMMGFAAAPEFEHTALLSAPVKKSDGRTQFLRVSLTSQKNGQALLSPLPQQGSHMLRSFALCDALAVLDGPAGEIAAGTPVPFVPMKGGHT